MGMAKVRRIAARAHRGQLTAGGGLFVDHLERVAQTVSELTSSPVALQAAWLYATPQAGVPLVDLYRQGVPASVVRVVDRTRPLSVRPTFRLVHPTPPPLPAVLAGQEPIR
jgi:(p)ppGpp synthase/HD superfamily hydrolase